MKLVLLAAAIIGVLAWIASRTRKNETIQPIQPVQEAEASPPRNARLEGLLAGYRLTDRTTEFFGEWRETSVDGVRVAFQGTPELLNIEVGEFDPDEEQLSEIYLGVTHPGRPELAVGPRRLDPFVGPEGRALAKRFHLNATGATEYPQLRIPAVRASLLALSGTVEEVSFYESGGFSLLCRDATREAIVADVKRAVATVKALASEWAAVR